jgi:hypothetical protein
MPKGKPWTAEEETKLRELVNSGLSLESIAAKLDKTPNAVYLKSRRLGLHLKEEDAKGDTTSSSIPLPKELPSVEEALKILAGALIAASKPGLNKVEVQRLQIIATLARTYEQLLARYIDYRGIEQKLIELEAKYAKLAEKPKSHATH